MCRSCKRLPAEPGASPGFRVADVHLLQIGKLGLRGSKEEPVPSSTRPRGARLPCLSGWGSRPALPTVPWGLPGAQSGVTSGRTQHTGCAQPRRRWVTAAGSSTPPPLRGCAPLALQAGSLGVSPGSATCWPQDSGQSPQSLGALASSVKRTGSGLSSQGGAKDRIRHSGGGTLCVASPIASSPSPPAVGQGAEWDPGCPQGQVLAEVEILPAQIRLDDSTCNSSEPFPVLHPCYPDTAPVFLLS